MEKQIVFTEKEYKELLSKFVVAFMDWQSKGYGSRLVSNETGDDITDINGLTGNFLIPWKKVFK